VLWAVESEPSLALLRELAAEWQAGSGVAVEVVGKSSDGLRADLAAAALTGAPPPALFWAGGDDLALLAEAGLIQPLEATPEGLLPAVVAGATREGKLWGEPLAAGGALLLLANRARTPEPPTTTDELIVRSRAARGKDGPGLVAGWAQARWLLALLNGYGGAATTPDGATPTLDTPAMVSALNLLRELRAAGPPAPSTYREGQRLFRRGQSAMAIDGDWSLESYRAMSDTLDLIVAPMPMVPATGRRAAGPLAGTYAMLGASLKGEALEQARSLIAFLAAPERQARIAAALHRLPARAAALADPAIAADPALAAAAQGAADAPGIPPTRAARCAWQAIDNQLPAMLTGDQSQQEAAAAMQRGAEACVAAQE
jgi:ABC-type glycerol-3-phosphate transport system substrate-binding protein